MSKNLSKRQVKQIARMWAGGILNACDWTSFDGSFTQAEEVLKEVQAITRRILKDDPILGTLPAIIDYVQSPSHV